MRLTWLLGAVLLALLTHGGVAAQAEGPVTVSLVENSPGQVSDAEIARLFEGMLAAVPRLSTASIVIRHFDHESDCSSVRERTVATLNPGKYLECQKETDQGLIPLFVVRKNDESSPYYSAAFLAPAGSPIVGLRSEDVRRLLLGPEASVSSYIAPLYQLYREGIITAPNVAAVQRETSWTVEQLDDSREIPSRIGRSRDAIGSIGLATDSAFVDPRTKPILRYGLFPQDVLFVSEDLAADTALISSWLMSVMSDPSKAELLRRYSSNITGLQPFNAEVRRAYNSLEVMRSAVFDTRDPAPVGGSEPIDPLQWIVVALGALFGICGVVLFSKKGHEGENKIRILGQEFTLAGSSLVVFVLGVVLVLVGVKAL